LGFPACPPPFGGFIRVSLWICFYLLNSDRYKEDCALPVIVGIDVGGTFTDVVLQREDNGFLKVAKVPSTPSDLVVGLIDGLLAVEVDFEDIGLIIHGSTVATNAVLERKGAACGLIMTEGFRDVIELRRRDRPHTYGLKGQFKPLVPRHCRFEVAERTDYLGNQIQKPDKEALIKAAKILLKKDVEVVIVSFINAFANPANEIYARQILEDVWPNPFVVSAAEVLPEIREFERTSTAVLNGYVQPLISRYLSKLLEALGKRGYGSDVLLVQSNGGVMSASVSQRYSVNTILSGPAAGVNAAMRLGHGIKEDNLITCDIGGTSLDLAVVVDGQPTTARETSLEYGFPIRIPMLDIRTVGAGGGSIAWIDRAGVLSIGPESAGADPGPVCYGQGGNKPTVTDANLVLGRINPDNPIGREAGRRLDKDAAEKAIGEEIGGAFEMSPEESAWTILQVANNKIASSIRTLTVEQGRDPRDFTLFAYGGAGPLHAAALIKDLEIARAIIPPWPGITSALGCLMADVRHDFVVTINDLLDRLEPDELYRTFADHRTKGKQLIESEGITVDRVEAYLAADMAYDGQIHEVRTPLPTEPCDRERLVKTFETTYSDQYGTTVERHPVRILTLRTAVIGIRPSMGLPAMGQPPGAPIEAALKEHRSVFFDGGFRNCPVYKRADLPRECEFTGPAVIEQSDSTTVVEPNMTVQVDAFGNLVLFKERSRS